MKRITYKQARAELSARCRNIKYFNKPFFDLYCKCLEKTRENVEKEIDDSFQLAPGVVGFRSWEPVYNSRLYQDNSGVYCEFLSVVYGRI